VEKELARRRVGDDRALVADDEVVEPGLLEVRPHRTEHAAGDDDDVRARGACARECVPRARAQNAVLGDQRPVQIEREGGDAPRVPRREVERYGAVPPVDFTT
jgi:hypothetical protein